MIRTRRITATIRQSENDGGDTDYAVTRGRAPRLWLVDRRRGAGARPGRFVVAQRPSRDARRWRRGDRQDLPRRRAARVGERTVRLSPGQLVRGAAQRRRAAA